MTQRYSLGSTVIGTIAVSSYKLTTKSIGTDRLLCIIFAVLAFTTFWFEQKLIGLILLAA